MRQLRLFVLILFLSTAACVPQGEIPLAASGPNPSKATASPTSEPTPEPATAPPMQPSETPHVVQTSVSSLPDTNGAEWVVVAQGLHSPLGLEHAGDDRLFIVERRGLIWSFQDDEVSEEPFLDITDRVTTQGSEQGLLGMTFHPEFQSNGELFVNYTDLGGDTVVSRFNLSQTPSYADAQSESVILSIGQPYRNHNAGDLEFGPEGYLYIPTGDGGSGGDPQGNAQNLNTLLGKILRIDIDSADPYAVPDGNFEGGRSEIWAYGLRNPWRIHFDRATGDLYIADVGQNQWEEVNVQPAGSASGWNFGWDIREGSHPFEGSALEGLVDPVAEYSHQLGISVTGGVVVRDPRLPEWQGVYMYGDFGSGIIWGLLEVPGIGWTSTQLWDTSASISSFGQDNLGRVYLVDYQGRILRLEPAS